MFFKRLSRSRNSYVDDDDEDFDESPPQQPTHSFDPNRPPSSYRASTTLAPHTSEIPTPATTSRDLDRMYPMRGQEGPYPSSQRHSAPVSSSLPSNGGGSGGISNSEGYVDIPPPTVSAAPEAPVSTSRAIPSSVPAPMASARASAPAPVSSSKADMPAPDPLMRAFNEAIRPHKDRVDELERRVEEMQDLVEQMEQQRLDIFNWIDKRGLRPDVPPNIAKQMDELPDAAKSLNSQLDRKITIVNFDLHRLQDDLNDSISSHHFASAMAKFMPDIQRLASLPGGPRFAYELLIKLVGNLNSHGGMDASTAGATDEEIADDRRARAAFYERMDGELVDVVRRRAAEGEVWPVEREVKRLESNARYLKDLGIEPYFPRSLELMRHEVEYRGKGSPPRY